MQKVRRFVNGSRKKAFISKMPYSIFIKSLYKYDLVYAGPILMKLARANPLDLEMSGKNFDLDRRPFDLRGRFGHISLRILSIHSHP